MTFLKYRKSVDEVFAFYNIFILLARVEEFRKWLKDYHHIDNDRDLFNGYKFLLEITIRRLIDAIRTNLSLGIAEDFTLYRAGFVGIKIDDIPNTCEKTVTKKYLEKRGPDKRIRGCLINL